MKIMETILPLGNILGINRCSDGRYVVLLEGTVEMFLPTGNILGINRLSDGRHVVLQEEPTEVFKRDARGFDKLVISENEFILIEAEKLSMEDKIMKFKPRGEDNVKRTQDLIAEAISSGVKNFYRPVMDPSFYNDGVTYVAGKKPALGKPYEWWHKTAKEFYPARNSRLGTRLEYAAFLGVLVKMLVAEGTPIGKAWDRVCNHSYGLGYYLQPTNPRSPERTGSVPVACFYDLANTYKLLEKDKENGLFSFASGCYLSSPREYPIARYHQISIDWYKDVQTGWIVLS